MVKLTRKRYSLDCQGLLASSLNWLSDCSTADSFSANIGLLGYHVQLVVLLCSV
jgi:hypothetical protein